LADIDPTSQIQQYTPRQEDLVDAVAESRRIIDAQIRSNPLRNAVIDDGLMRWRGNYTVGTSGSFLWIGEVTPRDNVLNKNQRGFILSRDDPKGARVLYMYDPFASTSNPSTQPLRQLFSMNDADDNKMFHEALGGGALFPWSQIALYPVRTKFTTIAGFTGPFLEAQNQTTTGSVSLLHRGTGSMTGTRIHVHGLLATNVNTCCIGVHMVCNWSNGATYTSARQDLCGNAAVSFEFDIDFKSLNVVGQKVEVLIYGTGIGSTNEYSWIVPERCYSYSN
jgi:hypothetical protein